MTNLNDLSSFNQEEFVTKAKVVYEKIRETMEKNHKEEFVAIEPDSETYFLGKDQTEAVKKAKNKYPDKIFYLVRVGHPAVITMSSGFRPLNWRKYGSLL